MSKLFEDYGLYSENESFVWNLAEKKLAGKSLYQMRNAKNFLDRAWTIRSTDPAMAKFRALNAVEEASCALVETLKVKHENAKRISTRDHKHKMAVIAGLVLGQSELAGLLSFNLDKSRDRIHFRSNSDEDGQFVYTSSGAFGLEEEDNPKPSEELMERIKTVFGNETQFENLLKDEAKIRDDILYATKDAIPDPIWDVPCDQFLIDRKLNATVAIGVACVVQDTGNSPLVGQILFSVVSHLKLNEQEVARIEQPNV